MGASKQTACSQHAVIFVVIVMRRWEPQNIVQSACRHLCSDRNEAMETSNQTACSQHAVIFVVIVIKEAMADSKQTSVRCHISKNHDYDSLKQNEAQNARTESALKGFN